MSSSAAYTLLGLTAIVAALVGMLAFAVMKFMAAAREARGHRVPAGDRTSAVADALTTAVAHAHVDQTVLAQNRAATAFRLRVGAATTALRAALDAGPASDAQAALERLAGALREHEPPVAPVDLKNVIDLAVSGYRITARARGGDLLVQGSFATVAARSDALDFLLTRLVSAALDACQQAGTAPVVAIRGERDDARRRLRLSIDDNGPGGRDLPDHDTIRHVVESVGGLLAAAESPMGGVQICLDLPIAAVW